MTVFEKGFFTILGRGFARVVTLSLGVRNALALLASVASAFAFFDALASAGAAGSRLSPSPSHQLRLVVEAALLGLAGAAILWLAVRIAATSHVLYPPFVLLALASFRWLAFPWQRWPIGAGMLLVGLVAAYVSLRTRVARPKRAPQT
jgi:hypothetical protein